MADLVVTVPKDFWFEWIDEGDAAGETPTGTEWGFWLGWTKPPIEPGEKLYIVAWGMLRGYSPVTRVAKDDAGRWVVCREGDAIACTVPGMRIEGFRGYRKVWWPPSSERPFEDWRTAGIPARLVQRARDDGFLASETAP